MSCQAKPNHKYLSLLDLLDSKVTETRAQLDLLLEWIRIRKSRSEKGPFSFTQNQLINELNAKMSESWKHLDSLLFWINLNFGQELLNNDNETVNTPEVELVESVESGGKGSEETVADAGDFMDYEGEGDGEFIILESMPKEEGDVEYDYEDSESVTEVPISNKSAPEAPVPGPGPSGSTSTSKRRVKFKYQCGASGCAELFSTMDSLRVHQARKHNCENPFPCPYCPAKLRYRGSMPKHILSCHPDKSDRIGKGTKCSYENCSRLFYDTQTRKRHELTHLPPDQRPYKCEICNKGFYDSKGLSDHSRLHTGEKPFKCTKCGRRFNYESTLKSHLQTHDQPEKRYKCDWENCYQSFDVAGLLKRHYKSHFQNQEPQTSSATGSKN